LSVINPMTEVRTERVIVGITREELDNLLASIFEQHRKSGYFYNDCGGRCDPDWINTYDKILSKFDNEQKEFIENLVKSKMSLPGIHRIMDQGCAHANSLRELTERFVKEYPTNHFEGYGVSGSLKDMWLGSREWDREITPEQAKLMEKHGIHPFVSYRDEEERNVRFFGIEDDIHKVMKDFPYELDLVISDNTYFHLVAPWLALRRTADRLSVGGVILVRTCFTSGVDYTSGRLMSNETILRNLRGDNPEYQIVNSSPNKSHPTIAVIKTREVEFKTNQYLSLVSEGSHRYIRSFYSRDNPRLDCIAIDTF